jgi:hypothetical protein
MNPWEFQLTFETPLTKLETFVKTIVSSAGPIQGASLTIDLVVFEPRTLIDMLARYSIPPICDRGLCLAAAGQLEVEELLVTVFSEWIDFLFVPEPASFAIYADHDEFTTFYAHSRLNLDRLVVALSEQGFKMEASYQRRF